MQEPYFCQTVCWYLVHTLNISWQFTVTTRIFMNNFKLHLLVDMWSKYSRYVYIQIQLNITRNAQNVLHHGGVSLWWSFYCIIDHNFKYYFFEKLASFQNIIHIFWYFEVFIHFTILFHWIFNDFIVHSLICLCFLFRFQTDGEILKTVYQKYMTSLDSPPTLRGKQGIRGWY